MATKTIVTKVDDIDGSPAESSFAFTWQGYKYQIDLSAAHAAEMKADFDKWVSAARRDRSIAARAPRAPRAAKAAPAEIAWPEEEEAAAKPAPRARKSAKPAHRGGRKAGGRKAAAKKTGPSASDIRAWATEQGMTVASRGRLAPGLIEQYTAAHTEQSIEL